MRRQLKHSTFWIGERCVQFIKGTGNRSEVWQRWRGRGVENELHGNVGGGSNLQSCGSC